MERYLNDSDKMLLYLLLTNTNNKQFCEIEQNCIFLNNGGSVKGANLSCLFAPLTQTHVQLIK